jgi:hypothetical protein
VGGGSSPLSCGVFLPLPLSQAFLLLIIGQCCCSCHPKWVFPPLLWSFPPFATLTSFPAPHCWARTPTPARASPAHPAYLFTVLGRIPFPQSSALRAPHPLSQCLYCSYCLLLSFSFFPQVECQSVQGGYAALAQACLWEYCGTAKFTWSVFPKPSGHWLLVAQGPSLFLHLT